MYDTNCSIIQYYNNVVTKSYDGMHSIVKLVSKLYVTMHSMC